MTPSGIEPATFRFVAQYINHCATACVYVDTVHIEAVVLRMLVAQYVQYPSQKTSLKMATIGGRNM